MNNQNNEKAGVLPTMQQSKVITCAKKGHYYDSAIYKECPHCIEEGLQQSETAEPVIEAHTGTAVQKKKKEKKEKKSFFSFGKKNSIPDKPDVTEKLTKNDLKKTPTVALPEFDQTSGGNLMPQKTNMLSTSAKKAFVRRGFVPAQDASSEAVEPVSEKSQEQAQEVHGSESEAVPAQQAAVPDLKAKPQSVQKTESPKTMAIYNGLSNEEPVVGWLVCIKGAYFGQSFNLVAGKNMIGRDLSMDVALMEEESISRNIHAILIYEPKTRQFILKEGQGKGMTYINDVLLLEHETLNAYDVLQFGQCQMVFVPFCNERFTWDDFRTQK